MAKKSTTKKSSTKTTAPVLTVSFTADGDVKTFEVPQHIAAINYDEFPARYFDGHRLLIRIDSFTAAWVLQTETFSDEDCSFLKSRGEWMPWITDENFQTYNEDADEWQDATIEQFYDALKREFETVGCVYLSAAYHGCSVMTDEQDKYINSCFIDTDTQQIVAKDVMSFCAKYEPGKNMFYHHDNNRGIRASRIDTLTITKKSGYQLTIRYTMADGNTVNETDVCTPEMAHEWINSKS